MLKATITLIPAQKRGSKNTPSLKQPIASVSWIGTVRWSLQAGQEEKRFIQLVLLGQAQHCPVQSNEHGDLYEGGDASSQWIDLIRLIELGNFLVHDLGIGLVFGLYALDSWLECLGVPTKFNNGDDESKFSKRQPKNPTSRLQAHLHLIGALQLGFRQRERHRLDHERHGDDAQPPRVPHPERGERPVEELEERLDRQRQEAKPPVPLVVRDRRGSRVHHLVVRHRRGSRVHHLPVREGQRGEELMQRVGVLREVVQGRRVDRRELRRGR